MKRRSAFTLVELVVVVMIIGVLVAIAAPKMINIMGDATDNSARQSLNSLRDAIETFASQNGGNYPRADVEANFKADIEQYLRGPLPKSLVGTQTADVALQNTGAPLSADGSTGWMYDGKSGEIIINCTDTSQDGTTTYAEF